VSGAQRYDELVRSLDKYGYTVTQAKHGYVVTSHTDDEDASYARHLDDLADFLDLMRWRERLIIRRQLTILRHQGAW